MTSPFPPPVLPPPMLEVQRDGAVRATESAGTAYAMGRPRGAADDSATSEVARPRPMLGARIVAGALGAVAVVLSWHIAVQATDGADADGLRWAAVVAAGAYVAAQGVVAGWGHRSRSTVDRLRPRPVPRASWRFTWATGWAATTPIAGVTVVALAALDAHVAWMLLVGFLVVLVRIAALTALGAELARVVLGARRRLTLWGSVIGAADLLVVGLLAAAVTGGGPNRDAMAWLAAWAVFALVDVGVGVLSYMRRVERWTGAWWHYRHEPSAALDVRDDDRAPASTGVARTVVGSVPLRAGSGAAALRPTPVPASLVAVGIGLRFVVVIAHGLVAAASLRLAISVLGDVDGLGIASDPSAAVDGLRRPLQVLGVSLLVLQAALCGWAAGQASAAGRATSAAPHPFVVVASFSAAPFVVAVTAVVRPDALATVAMLALLVNVGCWLAMFGTLAAVVQDLGCSARSVALWSVVASLHWLAFFALVPVSAVGDDRLAAGGVVLVAVVQAAIVAAAAVCAWRAMRDVEAAVVDRVGVDGT